MSSAILYLAIVAIWACVLIPRLLRRSAGSAADTPVPGDVVRGDAVAREDTSGGGVPEEASRPGPVPAGSVRGGAVADRARTRAEAAGRLDEEAAEPDMDSDAPPPLTPEESRQRMLAARRRLLGMLTLLEVAAIALAVLGLAALWVVIPPSVMLTGYLLLLREAAHADAERAQREQEAVRARAMARERARARERPAQRTAAAPAAPAARHEDSGPGRDFAPGLAGKYTTSNAEVINISERADEARDDQYPERKLRAVGD